MGSSVAPRFAINHPERMLGLVLVSPRASMQDRPGLLELWNSTISKLTDPIDPGFVRSFEHLFIRPVPEAFRKTVFQDALKVPAHVWRGSFQAALEDDLLQRTDKIKVPSLLVWGAEDASSPQSDRDAIMAAIMGSRRIIYPGVGHWPHAEAPDRFATDLVAFIEEHAK
jgi:pimeloyl-ACP methyl ester carboxylesterase